MDALFTPEDRAIATATPVPPFNLFTLVRLAR
jgi:hypothetical protein